MVARAVLLVSAVLIVAAPAPAALADGDPASDILPSQDAYYPYTPPVSKPLVGALNALLAHVRKEGFPMKLALIASPGDLGSYAQLYNAPQRYANLLASELPTQRDRKVTDAFHLLVVMPGGFGGEHLGNGVNEALDPVQIDPAAGSDGLARSALEAVARLATVNGHKTAVPPEAAVAGSGGSGGGSPPWPFLGGAVVLVAVAVAAGVTLRRRADPGAPSS